MGSPEDAVLGLLRARNRAAAPALAMVKAAESLLDECAALEVRCGDEQQRATLIEKEKHEMADDLKLLRENEQNAGFTTSIPALRSGEPQIEQLRDLLEKSKSEGAKSASDAAVARASEERTTEAARQMAEKLADAEARAADLDHSLKLAAAREEALKLENERLLERLTLQLRVEATTMDLEREKHEARVASKPPEVD